VLGVPFIVVLMRVVPRQTRRSTRTPSTPNSTTLQRISSGRRLCGGEPIPNCAIGWAGDDDAAAGTLSVSGFANAGSCFSS
jgi:hypothetical protein